MPIHLDKQQTRTFHQSVKGSGLNALVREMGLEPTRRNHTHLKRACLPFQHSRKCHSIIPQQVHFVNRIFPSPTTKCPVSQTMVFHIWIHILHKFSVFSTLQHRFHKSRKFLQVFEGACIILILFATIFHQNNSVFSPFLFYFLRHIPRFSNFPMYVIHSIHRLFHRFWRRFSCRTSQYSVFMREIRTFLVISKKRKLNFYRTFAF